MEDPPLSVNKRSAFTLLEAVVVTTICVVVLGSAAKILSNSSQFSEKLNDQQMTDHEALRLTTSLRADCRSAKSLAIGVDGESLEITRFSFDPQNNIRESIVTYLFAKDQGSVVREENESRKVFEFKPWQRGTPTDPKKKPDLGCSFHIASPAILCFRLFTIGSETSLIIDERVTYEQAQK